MRLSVTCAALALALSTSAAEPEATPTPAPAPPGEGLSLLVEHTLSRDEARERVTQMMAYWAQRFGLRSEWVGYRVIVTGSVFGIPVNAWFEVGETRVAGASNSPGRITGNAVHSYTRGLMRKYLHPTYQEVDD